MSQTITIENKEISVEQFRDDWALSLMSQGVIVRLSVGRWRATSSLTPDILGLKFTSPEGFEFFNKYLNLGTQKLLPPSVLGQFISIENNARKLLDDYSFNTVWGKFIPFTAFNEWEEKNNKVRDEFLNLAILFGNQYDNIVLSVKEDYKQMARDVWARLYPGDTGGPTESFVDNFADNIISKIPSREDIIASFKYSSTYFIIPMPSFISDDISKAKKIKIQEEMDQFNSDLEKQTKKKISDEYIKRKKDLIDGFLESTVVSMRKHISELCDAVLVSMSKSKKDITTSNFNKLKGMIKKVKLLNFYDDKEIDVLIRGLEIELDKIKGESSQEMIVDKLKKIVDIGKKEYIPSFNPSIGVLEL